MQSTKGGTPRYSKLDNFCYYYSIVGWTFKHLYRIKWLWEEAPVHQLCMVHALSYKALFFIRNDIQFDNDEIVDVN